jgi:hypothetical protein
MFGLLLTALRMISPSSALVNPATLRSASYPQCLGDLKRDGLEPNVKAPGVHDPLEPEYSILKQRIARRLAYEGAKPQDLSLVDITKAAERVISTVRGEVGDWRGDCQSTVAAGRLTGRGRALTPHNGMRTGFCAQCREQAFM